MNPITLGDDLPALAERIMKELDKLEKAEDNLKVDSSVAITIKTGDEYVVHKFLDITEASIYIANRMRQ